MNVAPETYTINEITYGEEPSVEAVLANGERIPFNKSDIVHGKLRS